MRNVPVRKRGVVVAHALVDGDDFERLNRWSWNLMDNGYAVRGTNSRGRVLMHREVLGLSRGDGKEVDHANQRKLDNRKENLRLATRSENSRNVVARNGSTSRFLGVSWCKQRRKWVASACANGRRVPLGRFEREEDAAAAAREWRLTHTPYVHGLA